MRKSAKQLGRIMGLSASEVMRRLANIGFLEGRPGDWSITPEGEEYGEERLCDNGYGGYAARSWSYFVWDEDVIDLL